jgi:hypothetical protein
MIQEIGFALDSPVEEAGFELTVPLQSREPVLFESLKRSLEGPAVMISSPAVPRSFLLLRASRIFYRRRAAVLSQFSSQSRT